jgi:hypothetical protein
LVRQSWLFAATLSLAAPAFAQTPPPIVYPAGKYVITTPGSTTVLFTATSVTFSWEATELPPSPSPLPPAPAPLPSPAPAPIPPAPKPQVPRIVGTIYAIQLIDGPPTPAQHALAGSATIGPALSKLNAYWYAWTTKSLEAACWLDDHDVKATGYPALLLVTANGAGNAVLSYVTKLPDTESDVLAIVQASRSKGVK